jgi:hypothetical protein
MANIFIHFEPLGAIGEDINIDPDLPSYIVRGEQKRNAAKLQCMAVCSQSLSLCCRI